MRRKINVDAARKYLKALAPGAVAFTFQTFSDNDSLKIERKGRLFDPHARTIRQPFAKAAKALADLNVCGVGVFVTINATKGSGRRLANFDQPRALWAELDEARKADWPIEPSIVVETSPGKFHVYWLIDDDMPVETWRGCMSRIVDEYGADKNATDPVRVLRVPGFYHCKHKPVMVRLVKCSGRRYTAAALVKAFPPIKRKVKKASVRNASSQVDVDRGALRSALEHLAATPHPRLRHGGTYADDYDTWVRFGLAIKRDLGDDGFSVWDEWGQFSDRYPGERGSRTKWDGLDVHARTSQDAIHVGTIFDTAKRQGWSFTRYQIVTALEKAREVGAQRRGRA
ncbi:MAG: hypothetical protein F9K29_03660 [Hyphomicrobiaceae bacterium]|nr:MAG: hypothetical protein F9K29_03660 [Hyphomicrobiaceae bacterium]